MKQHLSETEAACNQVGKEVGDEVGTSGNGCILSFPGFVHCQTAEWEELIQLVNLPTHLQPLLFTGI